MRYLLALWAAFALLVVLPAEAHEYQVGALKLEHPWARPTLAGQSAGGAYLVISNAGPAADRLLGARSAWAQVELHEMRMDGDVMRMRELKSLEVAPGQRVVLAPGGSHFMLMGLKAPLKLGQKLPLWLRFEKAGEVEVVLNVENSPAAASPAKAHKH